MLDKKVPLRMCIACKESKHKKELVRIFKSDNGFVVDKSGKLNGRGAYICNNSTCVEKLIKNKLLHKAFKVNVSAEDYQKIKETFFEN